MYLSKVRLPLSLRHNPYELHRQLWQLFPHQPDAQRDFLFRVEGEQPGAGLIVLLQSAQTPSAGTDERLLASKPFQPLLSRGMGLRFRLRANPVRTIRDLEQGRIRQGGRDAGKLKSCRVPLINEEEQREWLHRKFAGAASVDSLLIQPEAPLYFRKGQGKGGLQGKIQTVLFDGVLTLEDDEALVRLLCSGIGPGKAFGCGLLSLGRA